MDLLTTGQMIDKLRVGEQAEYRYEDRITDHHLIVKKANDGSIIMIKNGPHRKGIGKELFLNSKVMSFKWEIIPKYVTFEIAMKAHKEQKKTITYHHNDDFKYEFRNALETGQFTQLANDNLCLYELLEGKWTIEN